MSKLKPEFIVPGSRGPNSTHLEYVPPSLADITAGADDTDCILQVKYLTSTDGIFNIHDKVNDFLATLSASDVVTVEFVDRASARVLYRRKIQRRGDD